MRSRPDYFADPNGGAYRRDERRTGPPLDYVGEKLRQGLGCQHALLHALGDARAGTAAGAERARAAEEPSEPGPSALAARLSFGYQLTAYLALYNMLGARGSEDELDRLVAMAPEDSRRWLAFVAREGSVSGA